MKIDHYFYISVRHACIMTLSLQLFISVSMPGKSLMLVTVIFHMHNKEQKLINYSSSTQHPKGKGLKRSCSLQYIELPYITCPLPLDQSFYKSPIFAKHEMVISLLHLEWYLHN
jgi:hypothetical protein